MKTLLAAILLLGSLTGAQAQVDGLVDADIRHREAIDDPAAAVGEVDDGWFAFRYPAGEGTTTPCCWPGGWAGHWNSSMTAGCASTTSFTPPAARARRRVWSPGSRR